MNRIGKTAVIGAGSIGSALVKGWLKSGVDAASLVLTNHSVGKLKSFEAVGVRVSTDNVAALDADVLFLAVKPWVVESVVMELRDKLDYGRQVVVSLAAGVKNDALRSMFDRGDGRVPSLYCCIPNTAVAIGEGVSFLTHIAGGLDAMPVLRALLQKLGMVEVVDANLISAGTTLASCGLAYALRYVRAAVEGGVELGFRPQEAQRIVVQTVKGAAALLQSNGTHPEQEIDRVTTAGGLTIRGLNEMEHAGFTSAVIKGLKAGVK